MIGKISIFLFILIISSDGITNPMRMPIQIYSSEDLVNYLKRSQSRLTEIADIEEYVALAITFDDYGSNHCHVIGKTGYPFTSSDQSFNDAMVKSKCGENPKKELTLEYLRNCNFAIENTRTFLDNREKKCMSTNVEDRRLYDPTTGRGTWGTWINDSTGASGSKFWGQDNSITDDGDQSGTSNDGL
ncbi:hypothetical protein N9N67_02810 [Bacteriovoracaceae bacterium]|nr:hypothetical protein [Bacteriovoracaceae bacterium]